MGSTLAECPDAVWSRVMVGKPPNKKVAPAPMPLLGITSWCWPETRKDFPPTATTTSHSDYPAAISIRRLGFILGHLPLGKLPPRRIPRYQDAPREGGWP